MSVQQNRSSRKVKVAVDYGMGGSLSALFARDALEGESALEVLKRVLDTPQAPGSASRTARVVAEALKTLREIDLELVKASGGKAEGEPIGFDHVVVAREEEGKEQDENAVGLQQEEIRIRLSESYRGGGR